MLKKTENYYFLIFNLITFIVLTTSNYIHSSLKFHILRIPYILLLLLTLVVTFKILKNKNNISKDIKYHLFLLIVFFIIYIFVFSIRFLLSDFNTAWLTFYPAIIVIFSISIILAFKLDIFKYKYLYRDIIIIVSILTILQLFFGYFTYGGIRASKLLENIMVFNCVIISYLPIQFNLLLNNLYEKTNLKLFLILIINIILSIIITIGSGSRSAIFILFAVVIITSLLNIVSKRNIIIIISILILSITILYLMNASSLFGINSSIKRTSSSILKSNDLIYETNEISSNINESNEIRSMLRHKSIVEISKSPIIGTGNAFFKYNIGKVQLVQSSHNIILEIWLIFGLLGLILYILIISLIFKDCIKFFIKLKYKKFYIMCSISIFSILGLAMFQPLLIMLIPNITFWTNVSNIYIKQFYEDENE